MTVRCQLSVVKRCQRESAVVVSAFIAGISLMTFAAPPLDAAADAEMAVILADFTTDRGDVEWYVVNDNVMGGRSEGGFGIEQGELRFAGRTNTNGGGFSSIRARHAQWDLSKYGGIRLKVMGDGRRYTWRLATNARFRGRPISYWADFDTQDNAWSNVEIPFASFVPRFQGMRLDGPELNLQQITGMGVMIYDKLDGPFELRLANVQAYAARAPFDLEQYRWKNRVLVVSAPTQDDQELAELQAELASASEELKDRDMVFVTLLDSGVSIAGDRQLAAADAAATRAALRIPNGEFALRLIGKDGSIKLSTESVASISEIFALIDSMPMRQREKSDRK